MALDAEQYLEALKNTYQCSDCGEHAVVQPIKRDGVIYATIVPSCSCQAPVSISKGSE